MNLNPFQNNQTVTHEQAIRMNRKQRRFLGKINHVKIPSINIPAKTSKYKKISFKNYE